MGGIGRAAAVTFFINGKVLRGAQPFEAFEAKIEAALEEARALVNEGTPRQKVYQTLMRDAVDRPPSAE